MEQLLAKAYDKFSIELNSVQILFSGPSKLPTAPYDHVMGPMKMGAFVEENWHEVRKENSSPLHVLQKTGLKLLIEKSSIDDLRIPK